MTPGETGRFPSPFFRGPQEHHGPRKKIQNRRQNRLELLGELRLSAVTRGGPGDWM